VVFPSSSIPAFICFFSRLLADEPRVLTFNLTFHITFKGQPKELSVSQMIVFVEPKLAHIGELVFDDVMNKVLCLEHGIIDENELFRRTWDTFSRIKRHSFSTHIFSPFIVY